MFLPFFFTKTIIKFSALINVFLHFNQIMKVGAIFSRLWWVFFLAGFFCLYLGVSMFFCNNGNGNICFSPWLSADAQLRIADPSNGNWAGPNDGIDNEHFIISGGAAEFFTPPPAPPGGGGDGGGGH